MTHPPHPTVLLRVANACHPDLPPEERRRWLLDVAVARGDTAWVRRLREAAVGGVGPGVAMRMLSQMEEPWDDVPRRTDEGFFGDCDDGLPRWRMLLLLILLALLMIAALTRP